MNHNLTDYTLQDLRHRIMSHCLSDNERALSLRELEQRLVNRAYLRGVEVGANK